ncbi:MAG: glutamate synthase central domain-containing protein [Caldilineaceae bacterium]
MQSSPSISSEQSRLHPDAVSAPGLPPKQGLYDPRFEKDACGVGFVVNIHGTKSHEIVEQGLTILLNLDHRGARGSEHNTGDGAGILIQIPHKFFQRVSAEAGFALPGPGEYGVGMLFLPHDPDARRACEERFDAIVREEGQTLLGWRCVPTDDSELGQTAVLGEPYVRQVFIGRNLAGPVEDDLAFERKLYVIRKRAEQAIRYGDVPGGDRFYMPSLSCRTIVYKGMLLPEQMTGFYQDLSEPDVESALALVHSRFSTNTFPSWERAHPYRYLIHNGEINTLRGNINWMHARQSTFVSEAFGDDLAKVLPVINQDGSDSAMFDEALEFLYLAGRSLPHVMMMMIPEPWSNHATMPDDKKAFYEYHSTLMEPWDGPASIGFTDGTVVGAVLDRNGLRPSRYYVTKDGLVIMASEVGVLDIEPSRVLKKGRLEPGRMFLVDTAQGRIIDDEEIKHGMAAAYPYRAWLDENLLTLDDLPDPVTVPEFDHKTVLHRQKAFGYTAETLKVLLGPMAANAIEPVGAMGNDTPLAVLSDQPQLLYNYFKQLFAQVTNPPIDAIREELVTATEVMMGTEGNLLDSTPLHCRQIKLKTPILTNAELAKFRQIDVPGFRALTLSILFRVDEGVEGLKRGLEELYTKASKAIDDGYNILILSDRGISANDAPIPALLATSGLHHYLIREEKRTQAALIVETGEAREVHHFSLLVGYGATAINPYLAYESLSDMIHQGTLAGIEYPYARDKYIKAAVKGVVKTLSKMGISTMQSYCGAQIFEALGLSRALVDEYFTWTPTRIEGIGLQEIYDEVLLRHERAFPRWETNGKVLPTGGDYHWRRDGERISSTRRRLPICSRPYAPLARSSATRA